MFRRKALLQEIFQSPQDHGFVQGIIPHTGRTSVLTGTAFYHMYGLFQDLRHQVINFLRIPQSPFIPVIDKKIYLFFLRRVWYSGIVGDHRINIGAFCHSHHHSRIFYSKSQTFKVVVQRQLSGFPRHQQTAVRLCHIFRYPDPGTLCIIVLPQRPDQACVAQVLMIVELQLLVHGNYFFHINVSEVDPAPSQIFFPEGLKDPGLPGSGGHCIIIS